MTVIDVTEALDKKYVFKNAVDAGYKLPKIINDLIGYGSYAPMNQIRDIKGNIDIAMAVGFGKINSDIYMSLSTPLGTRFMNPGFGSDLFKLLFEPYDKILINAIKVYTKNALKKDVHSITVTDVAVDDTQYQYNLLGISITYEVINTPLVGNYVYPFIISSESYK